MLNLSEQSLRVARRALGSGALQPIDTTEVVLPSAQAGFVIRIASNVARKQQAKRLQPKASNPFLPHDPELFVADIPPNHRCLLNKFNVLDRHLLIVTREFESQDSLLNEGDFAAWWACLAEMDGLGFYNSGAAAGASQPHKHMQWVGLPLARQGPPIPIAPLLPADRDGRPRPLPGLPVPHLWVGLGRPLPANAAARTLHSVYLSLLAGLGLDPRPPALDPSGPYNLLLTRDWMMLIRRKREHFLSISLNALAFAGSFFVRGPEELALLTEHGPLEALAAV